MPLTIHTGRANAGKTGALYRELERAPRTGEPVLVLPTGPDVRAAEAEFARKGTSGVRIAQIDQYVAGLWTLWGDGRGLVDEAGRAHHLQRAVDATRAFKVKTASLVRLLTEMVRASELAEWTPRDAVASGIADTLHRYRKNLEESGLIEPSEAVRYLVGHGLRVQGPVAFNRFTDLSASQEALVLGLSQSAHVHVALTWQEGFPATAALDPLVARLREAGGLVVATQTSDRWTDVGLAQLEATLFTGSALRPTAALEFGLAGGSDAEAALIAQRVTDLVAGGIAPEEIAVLARHMGARAAHMAAALESHGVPAALEIAVPLKSTGLGATMLGLIEVASKPDVPRESLLAVLLGPYLAVDPVELAELDAQWRRRRASSGAMVREARQRFPVVDRALNIARKADSATAGEWAKSWERVASLCIANAVDALGDDARDVGTDSAAHAVIVRALSGFAALGVRPPGVELLQIMEALDVSVVQDRPRAVLLADAHRARGRRFECVIVTGLNADEFSSEAQTPLSVQLLARMGEEPRSDRGLTERMLFYTVVTRARQHLMLVRQGSDERGEARRPSVFWEELVSALDPQAAHGATPAGATTYTISAADVARRAAVYTSGRRAERLSQTRVLLRDKVAHVDGEEYLQGVREHEYSVSELETYVQCPYRWFVHKALQPRELDRAVDAREKGTRAHELLRMFYDSWTASGHRRVDPDTLDRALHEFDAIVQLTQADGFHTLGLAEDLAMAQATGWARGIVADDADFAPGFEILGVEVAFGSDAGSPFHFGGVPVRGRIDRLDQGSAGVLVMDYKSGSTVRGVEQFPTYGLLQPSVYAAAAAQLTGQGIAGALYRSLRSHEARGFWLVDGVDLGDRGKDKDGVGFPAIAAEIERAQEVVAAAVEGIGRGNIPREPLHSSACTFCSISATCGGAS